MKIYLDNCSLQRPFDDKSQMRIRLEAEIISDILKLCKTGALELVSSPFLYLEIERTPSESRRGAAKAILAQANESVKITPELRQRSQEHEKHGLKPFDAAHLACAEAIIADYFCTCDDKLLKKAKAIMNLKTKVISPLDLIKELEP
mgnify:CR=1 FL=1